MSQIDQIHSVLVNEGRISSWQAITRFRIIRLSALILNLRQMGLDIKSVKKQNSEGKRWVEYTYEMPSMQENKNRVPEASQVSQRKMGA